MSIDPAVAAALEAAVAADPTSIGLRIHLVRALLDGGESAAALVQATGALALEPDNRSALRLAAAAAARAGDPDRSSAYRRLADALARPLTPGPLAANDPSLRAAPIPAEAALEHEEELDRFLAGVFGELNVERPSTRLADVGGLEDVKRRLTTSFLAPLRNPELRQLYGKSLRGGLLLYGPPGCGKTFLARALAGELGARFFAVGLHDVLDMWLGQIERNLHEVFETARRHAPCVLFLDEVDALGMKRSNLSRSVGRNMVVQLLNELDGLAVENDGLFLLGATNQPWDVDPALLRPGRFDRMLAVLPPDEPARAAILARHLEGRPVAASIDLARLAKRTDGYSGADLRLVCEGAAEEALEASAATGTARPIGMDDLSAALIGVSPSTSAWLEMARNYVLFANHSGVYNDLLAYLRERKMA